MTDKKQEFDTPLGKVREIIEGTSGRDEKLMAICKLLRDNVSYYDWVGFYLVNRVKKRELILGPYVGEPTEHVRIPFGRGICGQTAERKETFVVQDVSEETNYLSCSSKVRSEIVVPIFKRGEIVGELDIDSHSISPFTEKDKDLLEKVCEMISKVL
ncbi:MAG: GAF domain-containing protein [bacterium]